VQAFGAAVAVGGRLGCQVGFEGVQARGFDDIMGARRVGGRRAQVFEGRRCRGLSEGGRCRPPQRLIRASGAGVRPGVGGDLRRGEAEGQGAHAD